MFRFDGLASRLWVLGQMALARRGLRRDRRILFWKLCGSGTGEGFTPKPNLGVWAILAVWPSLKDAECGTADGAVFRGWKSWASECWTLFLAPLSARGQWSGVNPFHPDGKANPADGGPFAILTRATVSPAHVHRFWRRVPDISQAIGANRDVVFKIGIGELPFLHQVTFSIWNDMTAMHAFAHADGPHSHAVRAVRSGRWFNEELYARFRFLGSEGSWSGARPAWDSATTRDVAP